MLKAILSPMGVSIGSKVNIGNSTFEVEQCTQILFTYHPKSARVTMRIGEHVITSPKKLDKLLEYAGYDKVSEMLRDFGAQIEFVMYEGKIVLYLLEFTEERFIFV